MQAPPVEIFVARATMEHSHLGCEAGGHLACPFYRRRRRLLAPQAGSVCYFAMRMVRGEMHPADGFLPKPACRLDQRREERSNARAFLRVDADSGGSFQIIRIVLWQVCSGTHLARRQRSDIPI